jgi:hypothetical protein
MKKKLKHTKVKTQQFVEPSVVTEEDGLKGIHNAFNLNLGSDVDKMMKVVTGKYRCPKLPGEPSSITALNTAVNPEEFRRIVDYYNFDKGTEIDSRISFKPRNVQTKIPPEFQDVTLPKVSEKQSASKIVVNIPKGWTVNITGDQIIMECSEKQS